MSIPEFNERGVLKKGIHGCKKDEFLERFCNGFNEGNRKSYIEILNQLFDYSLTRGAKSIVFGGSFIKRENNPNDLDCFIIVPNTACIPEKTEMLITSDCRLDLVYILEEDKKRIEKMLSLFSLDKFNQEVGVVEVNLSDSDKKVKDEYNIQINFEEVVEARKGYAYRHVISGSSKRGVLVTIHGLNTNAEWNNELAPIASSNNWIFAPFNYGNINIQAMSKTKRKKIIDNFRQWIYKLHQKYKMRPTILAHSFGTYILGKYISEFDYDPPVKMKDIVLAGSILSTGFDWKKSFEKNACDTVLNIVSPNDPWVPLIRRIKCICDDELYGTASNDGFNQEHPQLFSEEIDIYDHNNMLKEDIFEGKVIPYLNLASSISKYDSFKIPLFS